MKKDLPAELRTIEAMVRLYCRARHGAALCQDCAGLLEEASERLRRCPQDPKPPCRACPAPCHPPALRARLREVMRFAGPRMPLRHPLLTLRHYLEYFL